MPRRNNGAGAKGEACPSIVRVENSLKRKNLDNLFVLSEYSDYILARLTISSVLITRCTGA